MKKNMVVKIIKLLVICLVMALSNCDTYTPDPLGVAKPGPGGGYTVERTQAMFVLGYAKNLTVDKNSVVAPESYRISWKYSGLGPGGLDPSKFLNLDGLFFIITRSTSDNLATLFPIAFLEYECAFPNEYTHIDSTSFTFSYTPVTESDITIYHNIFACDGNVCGLPNTGGKAPVTVLVKTPIRLAISRSVVKIGTDQSYTLSWNRVEGMSGYELEVSGDQDFPPEKTTTIYQGDQTSYTASAPEYPRLFYDYFRVRAVSDTEASDWSNVVTLRYYPVGSKGGRCFYLVAPVTEVRVNEPFMLHLYTTGCFTGSEITPTLYESRNNADSVRVAPGTQIILDAILELIKEEPGNYEYYFWSWVETPGILEIEVQRSNPVYVTVLPEKQPVTVTLSVSSSETSYLEDYTLSWNSAGEVDGYEWQECAGDISNPVVTRVFPKQVLSWICAHRVAQESTFLYRVRPFSLNPDAPPDTLFEDWSPAVQVTVHPLQPPAGLAVTGPEPTYGMTSEITWRAVPHADRYRIEMTSGGSAIFLDSEATQISHKFLSLAELTIRVQAISGTDESAWSAPVAVTVAPAPPPAATLSSNQVESNESYTLDWTVAISEGLQAFIIEENFGGSSGELEIQPGERSRTFSHETESALTCTYRIKARYLIEGATVDTDWSDPVSLTINPLIVTPEAPVASISSGEIQSGSSVTISWNAVANATSYELNNITAGTTTSVSGTSIAVTLTNDQQVPITYQFTVTAVNESGGLVARSGESNTVSVEVAPASVPIATPEAPVASISSGAIQSGESVTISWNAVANATSYELNNITDGTTTGVSGTSRTVTLVNNQQTPMTYQFTVTAVNESGGLVARSGASNTVSVEVAPASIATPDAPNLTIKDAVFPDNIVIFSGESATLQWNAVANATSYEITCYEVDFNFNIIAGPTTTSVSGTFMTVTLYNDDMGMMDFYEYTVTAVNESGGQVARSSASNKVHVTVNWQ